MPYRIDLPSPPGSAIDRLIELGALDLDQADDGRIAAVMPDGVAPEDVARALGVTTVAASPATPRDDGSVWVVAPRATTIGPIEIAPAGYPPAPRRIRLLDGSAFGTGLHPTTALCVEFIDEIVAADPPADMLDVGAGSGSGVLALAALALGVPRACAIDIERTALEAAAANAALNEAAARLRLVHGGPEAVDGTWPLVVANIVAAPLIEMAPVLVRRVARRGRLVLSGIAAATEPDVSRAFRRLGLRSLQTRSRGGWVALLFQPSW
jgi:ribosomal protein L11 methylase PrmA